MCTSVYLHVQIRSFAVGFITAVSQRQTLDDGRFLSDRKITCGRKDLTGRFIQLRTMYLAYVLHLRARNSVFQLTGAVHSDVTICVVHFEDKMCASQKNILDFDLKNYQSGSIMSVDNFVSHSIPYQCHQGNPKLSKIQIHFTNKTFSFKPYCVSSGESGGGGLGAFKHPPPEILKF